MGTFLLNLKHSPLSPLNRASMIKCYIFQPLLQQVWLCPNGKRRYLAWGTGPGRNIGVRSSMHNNPISGPWNESLELDARLGGAGLGNMITTLAKATISDFVRCAYGPTDAARALTSMWHDRGNTVVHQALRDNSLYADTLDKSTSVSGDLHSGPTLTLREKISSSRGRDRGDPLATICMLWLLVLEGLNKTRLQLFAGYASSRFRIVMKPN